MSLPCMLWEGCTCYGGYGQQRYQGRQQGAHRVAWQLAYGPIPKGKQVLHKCDIRQCIEPTHLFLGTQQANMADKVAKGRQQKGEAIVQSRLSHTQVVEILADSTHTNTWLAAKYHVAGSTIGRIKSGERWSHIPRA